MTLMRFWKEMTPTANWEWPKVAVVPWIRFPARKHSKNLSKWHITQVLIIIIYCLSNLSCFSLSYCHFLHNCVSFRAPREICGQPCSQMPRKDQRISSSKTVRPYSPSLRNIINIYTRRYTKPKFSLFFQPLADVQETSVDPWCTVCRSSKWLHQFVPGGNQNLACESDDSRCRRSGWAQETRWILREAKERQLLLVSYRVGRWINRAFTWLFVILEDWPYS